MIGVLIRFLDFGKGFLPGWEWMTVWQRELLRDWWGTTDRVSRESAGVPDWAEYMDVDGSLWSRQGLLARLILDGVDAFGEAHVTAMAECIGDDGMRAMLDGWINARVFVGELIPFVSEGEA